MEAKDRCLHNHLFIWIGCATVAAPVFSVCDGVMEA